MEMFIKLTNQQLFGDFGSQTTQQMALGVNHECGERGGLRKNKKNRFRDYYNIRFLRV